MRANTPKHILIPVDFSEHSGRALTYGASMAKELGARVLALHVLRPAFRYIPLEESVWGATVTVDQLSKLLEENAKQSFETFLEQQPEAIRGSIDHEVVLGDPAHAVLDRAEKGDVDLIVVGSHGREGISRWVMGSVAERIVRHAHCPVLVVH